MTEKNEKNEKPAPRTLGQIAFEAYWDVIERSGLARAQKWSDPMHIEAEDAWQMAAQAVARAIATQTLGVRKITGPIADLLEPAGECHFCESPAFYVLTWTYPTESGAALAVVQTGFCESHGEAVQNVLIEHVGRPHGPTH